MEQMPSVDQINKFYDENTFIVKFISGLSEKIPGWFMKQIDFKCTGIYTCLRHDDTGNVIDMRSINVSQINYIFTTPA